MPLGTDYDWGNMMGGYEDALSQLYRRRQPDFTDFLRSIQPYMASWLQRRRKNPLEEWMQRQTMSSFDLLQQQGERGLSPIGKALIEKQIGDIDWTEPETLTPAQQEQQREEQTLEQATGTSLEQLRQLTETGGLSGGALSVLSKSGLFPTIFPKIGSLPGIYPEFTPEQKERYKEAQARTGGVAGLSPSFQATHELDPLKPGKWRPLGKGLQERTKELFKGREQEKEKADKYVEKFHTAWVKAKSAYSPQAKTKRSYWNFWRESIPEEYRGAVGKKIGVYEFLNQSEEDSLIQQLKGKKVNWEQLQLDHPELDWGYISKQLGVE